jgi:hypothetical protein
MSMLIDLVEKTELVYFLNDLILICEPDQKSEDGYRLAKHVFLS